ncbi:hypothetical protein AtEden1_Chr2g0229551 [Arabidopsis thaliana]
MKQEPEESASEHVIYIVSWNDHFFVLLVNHDAYYIIDTLGERVYEGCNQAYVLKFDQDAEIKRLPSVIKDDKADMGSQKQGDKNKYEQPKRSKESEEQGEEVVVCRGKESWREYIKSFLAAIPIQQVKADMKKGLVSSFHHRLQIELYYTKHLHHRQPNMFESSTTKVTVSEATVSVAVAWLLASQFSNSGGFGCEMAELLGIKV